jgi:hypothetical protein
VESPALSPAECNLIYTTDSNAIEQLIYLKSRIRGSLRAWAEEVLKDTGYRLAGHHGFLITELEALSNGQYDRLMILMPPGSAKSTYSSINTSLWGAYVPTPATAGNWYVWGEGLDGSARTVDPVSFTVR